MSRSFEIVSRETSMFTSMLLTIFVFMINLLQLGSCVRMVLYACWSMLKSSFSLMAVSVHFSTKTFVLTLTYTFIASNMSPRVSMIMITEPSHPLSALMISNTYATVAACVTESTSVRTILPSS